MLILLLLFSISFGVEGFSLFGSLGKDQLVETTGFEDHKSASLSYSLLTSPIEEFTYSAPIPSTRRISTLLKTSLDQFVTTRSTSESVGLNAINLLNSSILSRDLLDMTRLRGSLRRSNPSMTGAGWRVGKLNLISTKLFEVSSLSQPTYHQSNSNESVKAIDWVIRKCISKCEGLSPVYGLESSVPGGVLGRVQSFVLQKAIPEDARYISVPVSENSNNTIQLLSTAPYIKRKRSRDLASGIYYSGLKWNYYGRWMTSMSEFVNANGNTGGPDIIGTVLKGIQKNIAVDYGLSTISGCEVLHDTNEPNEYLVTLHFPPLSTNSTTVSTAAPTNTTSTPTTLTFTMNKQKKHPKYGIPKFEGLRKSVKSRKKKLFDSLPNSLTELDYVLIFMNVFVIEQKKQLVARQAEMLQEFSLRNIVGKRDDKSKYDLTLGAQVIQSALISSMNQGVVGIEETAFRGLTRLVQQAVSSDDRFNKEDGYKGWVELRKKLFTHVF